MADPFDDGLWVTIDGVRGNAFSPAARYTWFWPLPGTS